MKKIFLSMMFVSICMVSNAQQSFEGSWLGTLDVGVKLRLVFHVNESGDEVYTSTMDSPDQNVYAIACDSTTVTNKEIKIVLTKAAVQYTGIISNDSVITGTFMQRGAKFPLELKRSGALKIEAPKRPQTPKTPFSYKSDDVEYDNADKTLHYGATITKPNGNGPFPAILLITGSGTQDRDETIFNHKPFAVLADYLTRHGYIVMRVDDRGIGKSTGNFSASTSVDFAKDVNTSIDYLKTVEGVDKNKIGLMGHSEGGMIAPMVASERKDINFIVLLAGPGVRINELMAEQNAAVLKSDGVSSDAAEIFKPAFVALTNELITNADTAKAYAKASAWLNEWIKDKSPEILNQLDFGTDEKRTAYIHELGTQFFSPWFRYFMQFDPTPYLQKLKCKVLALNGSKDIQVLSSQNLPGIEAALKKSKSKNFAVKELPGLNHLFQTCNKCTVPEYAELEETFSPTALDVIEEWLDKNVKE